MATLEEPAERTTGKTRIQAVNEVRILDAAQEVFAEHGFRGATIDEIATRAKMSKPNLLYYFKNKRVLYRTVLDRTLVIWLEPLRELDAANDPESEIRNYITRKLEASRRHPNASRVFASEIQQGAPVLMDYLRGDLRELVKSKVLVIEQWIAEGKLAPIDPIQLLFMIWATTQHYADFAVQVRAVMNRKSLNKKDFEAIDDAVSTIFLRGILPRDGDQSS
jgi:TetR/AcrR family transcriptional regulator